MKTFVELIEGKEENLNESFSIGALEDKIKKRIEVAAKKLDISDLKFKQFDKVGNQVWNIRIEYTNTQKCVDYESSRPVISEANKDKLLLKLFDGVHPGDFYNSALGGAPKVGKSKWELFKFVLKDSQKANLTRDAALILGELSKDDLKILKASGKQIKDFLSKI